MVITEEEISEAIHSLFTESNPRTRTFTTLNQVVQELQSKLGHDLTHKLDFITSQINLLFASQQQQQQQQQQQHRQLQQQQQPPPQPQQPQQLLSFQNKDHFALHQNPNSHSVPVVTSVFRNNPITAAAADALAAQPPPLSPNVVPKERLDFYF
jgi:upstream activation factor subunit UAF30